MASLSSSKQAGRVSRGGGALAYGPFCAPSSPASSVATTACRGCGGVATRSARTCLGNQLFAGHPYLGAALRNSLGGGGGGGGRPRLPPASFQSARRPSLSRPRRQRSLGSEVRPSGEERGAPNGLSQNAPRSLRAWRSTLACGANPLSAWHTEYISLRRSLAPHRSLGVQREALRRGPHPQPSMGWWGMRARGEMPASGAWQELIFGTFGQSRGATEVRSYASYLRSGRQTMPN